MPLTRDFQGTTLTRPQADPNSTMPCSWKASRSCCLGKTSKAIHRDYIKATAGFEQFRAETG